MIEKVINISLLRKKLMYRSVHRGCKEIDIILGNFALKYVCNFSFDELIEYQKIVNINDWDLYYYITHKKPFPPNINNELINLIFYFIKSAYLQTQDEL